MVTQLVGYTLKKISLGNAMKESINHHLRQSILALVLVFVASLVSIPMCAQEYFGAIVPSVEEYERLPKVSWEGLRGGIRGPAPTHKIFSESVVMLHTPEVMAQGNQGSCVGWAVGYAAASILPTQNLTTTGRRHGEVQCMFLIKSR